MHTIAVNNIKRHADITTRSVIRPVTVPEMRRHKADKADRTADGDADADEPRDRNEQPELRALDIHADLTGVVLADGKGVELARAAEEHAAENDERAEQHKDVDIPPPRERAHRPEGDGAHLIVDEGQDQVDDAGNEHRKNRSRNS